MKITIVGIGQSLRGDDGIGPEAVRRWSQMQSPPTRDPLIETVFSDAPGLELLEQLEGADAAIIVDAVSSDSSPGTIRVMSSIPDSHWSPGEKTAHGFGVAETLALAKATGARLPEQLILIGIEGHQYALGEELSSPVRSAIPQVVEEIQKAIFEILSAKDAKQT
jgi:hydrogenase maturation protease